MSKIYAIDLFSGAGGLSYGLSQNNINIVLANEIEKDFANTFRHNHPKTKMIHNDIHNIAGFNRLFMREPLSYTFIKSAKITVEEASFVQIIKALKNLFTKKIRIVIRKIIMSLK